jgi:hypothetical protein
MDKPCARCRFYRQLGRPLTDRLEREISHGEATLTEALTRLSQEELQKKDAETSRLRLLLREKEIEWRIRPELTSHCGVHEAGDVHYVAELKNPRSDCDDFEARPPGPRQECSTCRHRVLATGPERDEAHFAALRRMAATSVALGEPGGQGQLNEFRSWIAAAKVREATQAFQDRTLSRQPRYLSICAKHSRAASFVPCVVQNPHDDCPDWSSPASAASASPARGWGLIPGAGKRAKP